VVLWLNAQQVSMKMVFPPMRSAGILRPLIASDVVIDLDVKSSSNNMHTSSK